VKTIERLTEILSLPAGYRLFRRLVGGRLEEYVAEYVRPRAGDKVLDLGCGPGDMLRYLPSVDYLGLDISREYIEAAKKRFGSTGRFLCADVGLATLEQERNQFDLVLATGVLHHLDDQRAARLFELARVALRPGGKLITYDGCYVPEQSRLARWVLSKDRGKFVRSRDEYVQLASAHFSIVQPHVRHDLLRIPYTHLIMFCSK
jgi:cyclopropane fatty-acyl-phospholipid synthase-like methyltransferase